LLYRVTKKNIYLYKPQIDFNNSQTTFINNKRHIQKCDQISPESIIYYIQTTYPKVHIIPSSQVQYIKTSLRTAHGNWDPDGALAGDSPMCDPGDAPAGDASTCDPGDPPTWFDDAPECR
jgi:hypothetical protein